jgi:hypothetical protein
MRYSHLSRCAGTSSRDSNVVDIDKQENESGEDCGYGPREVPASEPGSVSRFELCSWEFFDRRQRKRDDVPAVGTDGEVGEHLLLFVRRQSVFDEGVELVRVWMVPGLKEFAHS